jgi:pyruvate dehydrogenase E2 component (dihydrolipoamide acetyltransferase)
MPVEITMPRLSDTMEQGTVVKWNVKEGDSVSPGDVLADIETDKATMELESFDEGTVAKIAAEEGQSIAVGQIIMVLAEEGEDAHEAASGVGAAKGPEKAKQDSGEDSGGASTATKQDESSDQSAERAQSEAERQERSDQASQNGSRIFASPLARKLASENNIDLSQVRGTGPSGRIVRKDVDAAMARGGETRSQPARAEPEPSEAASAVEAAVSTAGPAPAYLRESPGGLSDQTVALSNMRATIAKRLVESKQTVPHYQVTVSARLDNLMALRKQLNEQLESQGVKLSVNDFLVRACALAMHEHPFVNSSWSDTGGKDGGPAINIHGRVNIGVAVALPMERGGGLVVATLRDADRRGLRDLSE